VTTLGFVSIPLPPLKIPTRSQKSKAPVHHIFFYVVNKNSLSEKIPQVLKICRLNPYINSKVATLLKIPWENHLSLEGFTNFFSVFVFVRLFFWVSDQETA